MINYELTRYFLSKEQKKKVTRLAKQKSTKKEKVYPSAIIRDLVDKA